MRVHNYFVKQYQSIFLQRLTGPAVAVCLIAGFWNSVALASSLASTKHWVGTWASAPYNTQAQNLPPTSFDNYTVRQIVRMSIGGDTVRVKFSNITCSQSVIIKKATIAISPDSSKKNVDGATITALKFKDSDGVTIDAKSEVYSDPVAFKLPAGKYLAITIFYEKCKSVSDMTFHYGSRTDSYYISGDKTESADFAGAASKEAWYTISTVEVLAQKTAAAVAVIGNSITDGTCLHGGQMKWTDHFAAKLLKNPETEQVGVLNLGIGATLVTRESNGAAPGIDRFKHDILEQSGVKWVIIFYGVNDAAGGVPATAILNGIKKMANEAHAKDTGIKVYGATMTPFQGYSDNSYTSKESVRIQFNDSIRSATFLDGYLDFEKAIQDPNNPTKMKADLQCDYLHPNAAGYKVLGESIDLKLFTPPPVKAITTVSTIRTSPLELKAHVANGTATITFTLRKVSTASVKIYSLSGKEIISLDGKNYPEGTTTVQLNSKNLIQGAYLLSVTTGELSASRQLVVPGR